MFQRAGRVVTVSQTLRERTLQRWGLDPDQVTAVENGADVSLFSASPQAGTAGQAGSLRQQYGLGGGPLVMFVGSFKPWHGLDLLVEAFSRVSPAHPQARLAFVGDGPTRPDLEAQVSALGLAGRVIFTGAVPHPDVAALLASADVTVLNPRLSPASLSQSPLKLFEYMAAGKAIIAPDIPNMQRLLSHRQTALLVQPDQAGALAQALAELLEDEGLRRSLGQAAARQALQAHSWERTVEELEKIFLEELGRKGGR
jgi:glycosyltransferase involved in cell wall biosynthesis